MVSPSYSKARHNGAELAPSHATTIEPYTLPSPSTVERERMSEEDESKANLMRSARIGLAKSG